MTNKMGFNPMFMVSLPKVSDLTKFPPKSCCFQNNNLSLRFIVYNK